MPEAESAVGGITYRLSPIPDGFAFDESRRQMTGIGSSILTGQLIRYTAIDSDRNTAYLEFRLFIRATPYTYPNEDLISLLPPGATQFEKDVEMMLRASILPVDENSHIRMPIIDAWNPDTVPVHLIPYLGINLSTIIDTGLSEAQQRELLRKSYQVHSYEGTPQALLDVIFALGYSGAVIVEGIAASPIGEDHWADYKILLNEAVPADEASALLDLVKDVAPVWCRLTGIDVSSSTQVWDGSILFDGTYNFGEVTDSGITN